MSYPYLIPFVHAFAYAPPRPNVRLVDRETCQGKSARHEDDDSMDALVVVGAVLVCCLLVGAGLMVLVLTGPTPATIGQP